MGLSKPPKKVAGLVQVTLRSQGVRAGPRHLALAKVTGRNPKVLRRTFEFARSSLETLRLKDKGILAPRRIFVPRPIISAHARVPLPSRPSVPAAMGSYTVWLPCPSDFYPPD